MSLDFYLEADVGGPERITVFDTNMTHNVAQMWREAGVYVALYESQGETAGSIIGALERGVARMKVAPSEYMALNAPNGWGTYKQALPWLESVLEACKSMPRAIIRVSR